MTLTPLLPAVVFAGFTLFVSPSSTFEAFGQASASAQRFSPSGNGYVERARIMLEEKNYSGVIDQLQTLITENVVLDEELKQESLYMLAVAYYQRGDSECLRLLEDYCRLYPASPFYNEARLLHGDYYFFKADYPDALTVYNGIDPGRLNKTQLTMYTYRKALSMIKTGYYDESVALMKSLLQDKEYADAAKFYLAYVDYVKGNYDAAYEGFLQVGSNGAGSSASSPSSAKRRGINPYKPTGLEAGYYLTQIDYMRGKYSAVINQGESLLVKMPVAELVPETERIVGMSAFKLGDYQKARLYLNKYLDSEPDAVADETLYALGVMDYNDGDYESAGDYFRRLKGLNNELEQSAWLYLGQIAVKDGNPSEAAMDFEKAAKMNFDLTVRETALYNYGAAITAGGNVPFSSAATLLEDFLRNYPSSEYAPAVEEYLAEAYLKERNYTKALEYLNVKGKSSAKVRRLRQMALYGQGVERFSASDYSGAISSLSQAAKGDDSEVGAEAEVWLGEALYASGKYADAARSFTRAAKELSGSSNRTLALYNLAYCDYQQEHYKSAVAAFQKALAASPALPASLRNDALIRLADCQYYTGNYSSAAKNYSTAVSSGAAESDYAAYRKAVMTGLAGNGNEKIKELREMRRQYPSSKWVVSAMMEEANTLQAEGKISQAAQLFNQISSDYPENVLARKARLNMALSYAEAGEMEKAAAAYKDVVRNWPSSEEAALAHDDLRRYYASTGGLVEYDRFLKSVPGATQLDASEMEQLAFEGAESAFADKNSIALLEEYVAQYPDGKYLAQALLDISSSLAGENKDEEALRRLDTLLELRKFSPQYPEALLLKGEVLERDKSRRDEALNTYRLLEASGNDFLGEAYIGIMRNTTNPTEKLKYARLASRMPGIEASLSSEALYCEAEALQLLGENVEALKIYGKLSENPDTEAGAKSAVAMARYYLEHKEYAKAEKLMLEFTDSGTPCTYQLAEGFIALADAYHGMGKTSLAREYLTTLSDNYPGNEPEIHEMISKRLKNWGK